MAQLLTRPFQNHQSPHFTGHGGSGANLRLTVMLLDRVLGLIKVEPMLSA